MCCPHRVVRGKAACCLCWPVYYAIECTYRDARDDRREHGNFLDFTRVDGFRVHSHYFAQLQSETTLS